MIVATLWMCGAILSFSSMAVSGRELSFEMSTFELLFFRSVIGFLIVAMLLTHSGWGQVLVKRPLLHLGRNLAHFVGQYGWYYGLGVISLAEVFAIEFTVPVWAAALAVVFLGEKLTWTRAAAIGLGVLGLLIILRPGTGMMKPEILIVLIAAMGFSVSYVITKRITATDSALSVLFYMVTMQMPIAFFFALNDLSMPTEAAWPWLLIVSAGSLSAHYCVTRALMVADAMVVVAVDFLRLPLIAVVGYWFYAEPLDWFLPLGVLVMLTGTFINIRGERRRTEAPTEMSH